MSISAHGLNPECRSAPVLNSECLSAPVLNTKCQSTQVVQTECPSAEVLNTDQLEQIVHNLVELIKGLCDSQVPFAYVLTTGRQRQAG